MTLSGHSFFDVFVAKTLVGFINDPDSKSEVKTEAM